METKVIYYNQNSIYLFKGCLKNNVTDFEMSRPTSKRERARENRGPWLKHNHRWQQLKTINSRRKIKFCNF